MNKKKIAKEADVLRKEALKSLIKLEAFSLGLANELPEGTLKNQLRNYGISTVDNAIDDCCNGIGFILEDHGFPIKGQL